LGYYSSLPS